MSFHNFGVASTTDLHRQHTRRNFKGNGLWMSIGLEVPKVWVCSNIFIINSEGNALKGAIETFSVNLVRGRDDASSEC